MSLLNERERLTVYLFAQVIGVLSLLVVVGSFVAYRPFDPIRPGFDGYRPAGPVAWLAKWLVGVAVITAVALWASLLVAIPVVLRGEGPGARRRSALLHVGLGGFTVVALAGLLPKGVRSAFVAIAVPPSPRGVTVPTATAGSFEAALTVVALVGIPVASALLVRSHDAFPSERHRDARAWSFVTAATVLVALSLAGVVVPALGDPPGPLFVSSPGMGVAVVLTGAVLPGLAAAVAHWGPVPTSGTERGQAANACSILAVTISAAVLSVVVMVQLLNVVRGQASAFTAVTSYPYGEGYSLGDVVVSGVIVVVLSGLWGAGVEAVRRFDRGDAGTETGPSTLDRVVGPTIISVGLVALVLAFGVVGRAPEEVLYGSHPGTGDYAVTNVLGLVLFGGAFAAVVSGAIRTIADEHGRPDLAGSLATLVVVGVGAASLALVVAVGLEFLSPVNAESLVVRNAADESAVAARALVLASSIPTLGLLVGRALGAFEWENAGSGRSRRPTTVAILAIVGVGMVVSYLGGAGIAAGLVHFEHLEPADGSFAFEYDPVNDTHGRLTVTREDGDGILSRQLSVRGSGFASVDGTDQTRPGRWQGTVETMWEWPLVVPEERMATASQVTVGVESGCTIRVVYEHSDDPGTTVLDTYECPAVDA